MDELVEATLKPLKELPKPRTPNDKELIERRISATDNQTDALVVTNKTERGKGVVTEG